MTAPPLATIVPFALPPERVAASYRQWLGPRLFRPHGLNRAATDRLQRVYVPAWHCRGTAERRGVIAVTKDGDRDTASTGQRTATYSHLLISATSALPADWLVQLGGFDVTQARPANDAVTREIPIEAATLDHASALAAARRQIEAAEHAAWRAANGEAAGDVSIDITGLAAELIGLPVWLATVPYHGKVYQCLINGQTGATAGEAPVSGTKIAVLFSIVILAIVAVLILTQLYGS